ncbi:hypothetical protein D1007_31786 [Hordeum vulgare]|nr:hypothetical protein D1007_31786 [Hordeum vulgare]
MEIGGGGVGRMKKEGEMATEVRGQGSTLMLTLNQEVEVRAAAKLTKESISQQIQVLEKNMTKMGRRGSAGHKDLLQLQDDMMEVSRRILSRVDSLLRWSCFRAIQPPTISDETEMGIPATTQRRTGDDDGETHTVPRIRGEGGSVQVSAQRFEELLVTIFISMARNMSAAEADTMAPLGSGLKLNSLLSPIDELWDDMRQLVSTETKFLATCVFTREPLAHCISTLQLISAVFDWLSGWVPAFTMKLLSIREDEDMEWDEDEDEDEDEKMQMIEESNFANYISRWERTCSNGCSFEDTTLLSSMLFTHYIPGHAPLDAGCQRTMQIYSMKVAKLEGHSWPLKVFGVVAARDVVDNRRNILFFRSRDDYQLLTEHDPFLHLTGPSRAIISTDTVKIEIQLKLKGTTKSEDRALISKAFSYNGDVGDTFSTRHLSGHFCTIELCCEHLERSLQATILSIRVLEGSMPCENGIRVVCSSLPSESPSEHVLLFASKAGTNPVGEGGYLDLSRQVISVKRQGRLEILVEILEQSGCTSHCFVFTPESSNVSPFDLEMESKETYKSFRSSNDYTIGEVV